MKVALRLKTPVSVIYGIGLKWWRNWAGQNIVCDSELRQYVSIPRNRKVIDAVFTKHSTEDSFRIVKPRIRFKPYYVQEYTKTLSYDATGLLKMAYRKGYRYVHFEYSS